MSESDGSGRSALRGRRGFTVDGSENEALRAPKPRSIADALRLNRDQAPDLAEGQAAYNAERIQAFLAGRITLGDLEGITKQEQYQVAEVAHSYLASGKLDEAKTMFEGLLALDPFDAYFHTALGSVAQQTNDLEEAEKRYSRALEINPYFATAMANRGEVRVMQGRVAEGAEDLIRAVQADPKAKEPATQRAQATLNVLREQLMAAANAAPDTPAPASPTPVAGAGGDDAAPRAARRPRSSAPAGKDRPSASSPTGRAIDGAGLSARRRPMPRKK